MSEGKKFLFTFGKCLECKKLEALKNGYCSKCYKNRKVDNRFGEFGKSTDIF